MTELELQIVRLCDQTRRRLGLRQRGCLADYNWRCLLILMLVTAHSGRPQSLREIEAAIDQWNRTFRRQWLAPARWGGREPTGAQQNGAVAEMGHFPVYLAKQSIMAGNKKL